MTAQDRGWGPPCPDAQIVRITAGGRSFNVHRKVARIFEAFIHELTTRTNYSIDEGTLDDWSYNCRRIAGSTAWSNHAWGLAIDVNSLRNPMKAPPMVTDMPAWVRNEADLLRRYGLRWGGEYTTRPDPMHFEFMLSPADADRITASLGTGAVGGEWYEMPIPESELAKIASAVVDGLQSPRGQGALRTAAKVENDALYRLGWRGETSPGEVSPPHRIISNAGLKEGQAQMATALDLTLEEATEKAQADRAALLAAIEGIQLAGGGDPTALINALQALPEDVVAAIKEAL